MGTKNYDLVKNNHKNTLISLANFIFRISKVYNCSNVTLEQCIDFADILLTKFSHDTIEDIFLMLDQGKNGQFKKDGKIIKPFNRFDITIILEWCEAYFEQKAIYFEANRVREKQEENLIVNCPSNDAKINAIIQNIKDELKPSKFNESEYLKTKHEYLKTKPESDKKIKKELGL